MHFNQGKGSVGLRVIFLDVDGVLAYEAYRNEETANIDLEKVKLLKEICTIADASVVISSSWRGTPNYTPDCYYTLISILQANGIKVLGNTPHLIKTDSNRCQLIFLTELEIEKEEFGTGTAAEIQEWLCKHKEVTSFVILDDLDLSWKKYGYDTYWIQPTWFGNGGLQREHVEQAIKLLKKEIVD